MLGNGVGCVNQLNQDQTVAPMGEIVKEVGRLNENVDGIDASLQALFGKLDHIRNQRPIDPTNEKSSPKPPRSVLANQLATTNDRLYGMRLAIEHVIREVEL